MGQGNSKSHGKAEIQVIRVDSVESDAAEDGAGAAAAAAAAQPEREEVLEQLQQSGEKREQAQVGYVMDMSETERMYREKEEREKQDRDQQRCEAQQSDECKGEHPHNVQEDTVLDPVVSLVVSSTTDETKREAEEAFCPICHENNPLHLTYALDTCRHLFCIRCLFEYLQNEMEISGASKHTILCPGLGCDIPVSVTDLENARKYFGSSGSSSAEYDDPRSSLEYEDARSTFGTSGDKLPPEYRDKSLGLAEAMQELRASLRASVGVFSMDLTKSLELFISQCESMVRCPNPRCGLVFERIPLSADDKRRAENVKDERGNPLSQVALDDYLDHRFRCRHCDSIFCSKCHTMPYHLGHTCHSYLDSLGAKKCRYCESDLPEGTTPYEKEYENETWGSFWTRKRNAVLQRRREEIAMAGISKESMQEFVERRKERMEAVGEFYVCSELECQQKAKNSCQNITPCNHLCGGVKGESQCLPCLKPGCCPDGSTEYEDFCNICWVEDLGCAPAVQLGCGHIFHHHCVTERLQGGFSTSYISFGHAKCPLCNEWISHQMVDTSAVDKLHDLVRGMAQARLSLEGMDNDPALQPGGEYEGRQGDYALKKFAFYICDQCKNPYFGGKKACDAGGNEVERGNFRREDLVCSKCSGLDSSCAEHGTEYIEFKCRFCCSLATYFCAGAAHFCTPCHDRAGDFVDFARWETKFEAVSDCPGLPDCPLGVLHPPNGFEFAMGCAMCRQLAATQSADAAEPDGQEKEVE